MAITDAFTGSNGDGIEAYSSDWAYVKGSGTDIQIQSNGFSYRAAIIEVAAQRTEAGFPGDHYAQVTNTTVGTTNSVLGVAVRCQGADSEDYYGFYGNDSSSQMFENDGAGWTQIGSNGAGTNATQTIRLTISGTTLTPAVGGATQDPPGALTDATFSGGAPGIALFTNSGDAAGTTRSDDFESTDAAAPSAAITGTATETITEADIVAGGKTVIVTLTDETFVPALSTTLITHITTQTISTLTAFTTSFTITLPATTADDLLLLEYAHRSTNTGGIFGTDGSQTSWTLKHSRTFGASSTFSAHLYYRRATGNHSTQAIAVSSTVNSVAAHVIVYRGALASGDPLASATVVGEWNSSGNEAQAGISTDIAGTMVCLVVANSPDFAIATQSSIAIGALTERADTQATAGTDASIAHASAIWSGTGDTSTFSWAQTNASSGSFAYAITPQTTSPFDSARQDMINGMDSAQAEGTGWDAVVKAGQHVSTVVRTNATTVTITLSPYGSYNITAQETITVSVPGSILLSGTPILATPTFTIDTAGAAPDSIRIFYPTQWFGQGVGGVQGGNRTN